jgi:hypothetical protein
VTLGASAREEFERFNHRQILMGDIDDQRVKREGSSIFLPRTPVIRLVNRIDRHHGVAILRCHLHSTIRIAHIPAVQTLRQLMAQIRHRDVGTILLKQAVNAVLPSSAALVAHEAHHPLSMSTLRADVAKKASIENSENLIRPVESTLRLLAESAGSTRT